MADSGYGCEFGDCTSAPNHLLTTIAPPATVSLCDDHYPAGLIPLLAAELGVDPGDFYGHVEKYLARENKKAEKALADAQAAEAAKGSEDASTAPDTVPGDDASQRRSDDDKAMGNDEREEMFP